MPSLLILLVADDSTDPPLILAPNLFKPLAQTFFVEFVVPEPAMPNSVKLTLTRTNGRSDCARRPDLLMPRSCSQR